MKTTNHREIYLVRHGFSAANQFGKRPLPHAEAFRKARKVFGSQVTLAMITCLNVMRGEPTRLVVPDAQIPLVSDGIVQSFLTGQAFGKKGIPFNTIVSALFLRAQQTRHWLIQGYESVTGKPLGAVIQDAAVLNELNTGSRFGLPSEYYPLLYPRSHARFLQDRITFRPNEGESIMDVYHNRRTAFFELLENLSSRCILLIGHGYTNVCIRSWLTGEDLRKVFEVRRPNVGVCHLVEGRDGKWEVDPQLNGSRPLSNSIVYTE